MEHYPEFEALLMEQEAGATTLLFKYIQILKKFFGSNSNLSIEKQKEKMNYFYEKVTKAHPLMAIFSNTNNYLINNDGDLIKCSCGNIIGRIEANYIKMKQHAFVYTGTKI